MSYQFSSQNSSEEIRIEGHIVEGQALDAAGHAVRVTVIRGGRSKNGFIYNEEILQSIAHMLENARAYADHASELNEQQVRSVRDIVGFYHEVRYIPPEAAQSYGRVDATLHIMKAANWLWELVHESCELGRSELIGLSIDIFAQWRHTEGSNDKEVTQVLTLNSCDIVTRPSAGGALRRILHSDQQALPGASKQIAHDQHGGTTPMSYDQQPSTPSFPENKPVAIDVNGSNNKQDQASRQFLLFPEHEVMQRDVQSDNTKVFMERRLNESALPEPVKRMLRDRYQGRVFEQQEFEADLQAQQEMLATLAANGLIRGHSYEKPSVGQIVTEAEKIQAAFDRMFELDIANSNLGNIRPFTSIREAYARVTGDASVSSLSNHSLLGNIRVSEHAPFAHISEADTTTASFSHLLGVSMNKRLLKDYQAWPAEWMKFTTIIPIRDFKEQKRVRLGSFGSLPLVVENSAYTAVAPTDTGAIYTAQKRGNLVTISREVILNDDLQAIKQIPARLAVAAAYTLAEFVYSFLSTNPTIYDGSVLFTTGNPHNNLGAAALSSASLQGGVTAMRKQTNFSGKRIGLRPRYLIIPPELEWQSMVLTSSTLTPGTNNNDINPMLGYVAPIVSAQLTSSTEWFLASDPREVDTIEIGFVGGQVNPTLLLQDSPTIGLNFTQDALSYKIRHEYGGAVVDFRGLYRGI